MEFDFAGMPVQPGMTAPAMHVGTRADAGLPRQTQINGGRLTHDWVMPLYIDVTYILRSPLPSRPVIADDQAYRRGDSARRPKAGIQ